MIEIEYKTNSATKKQVYKHLKECDSNFVPTLGSRIDLKTFSEKIINNATVFEAWYDNKLIGMVSAYFNDSITGFINNVSVSQLYMGKGLASHLLRQCINYGENNNFFEINLEVSKKNITALNLYRKFGFYTYKASKHFKYLKYKIITQKEGY